MDDSKFDLCADSVTLDYEELVRVSIFAVKYSLDNLEDRLRKWHSFPFNCTGLDAGWMLEAADALAVATRAHHYLVEGRARSEVIVERR